LKDIIILELIYTLRVSCNERTYFYIIKTVLGAHLTILIWIVKKLQPKNKLIILKTYFYEKFTEFWCSRVKY
jgi:hypothetical protein